MIARAKPGAVKRGKRIESKLSQDPSTHIRAISQALSSQSRAAGAAAADRLIAQCAD